MVNIIQQVTDPMPTNLSYIVLAKLLLLSSLLHLLQNYCYHCYCRGIVTADVLVKGLSHGAIATRKHKGVNRDKGHERFYTSSVPYDEGKSLRLVVLVLLGFRSPRGQLAGLVIDLLFLAWIINDYHEQ